MVSLKQTDRERFSAGRLTLYKFLRYFPFFELGGEVDSGQGPLGCHYQMFIEQGLPRDHRRQVCF